MLQAGIDGYTVDYHDYQTLAITGQGARGLVHDLTQKRKVEGSGQGSLLKRFKGFPAAIFQALCDAMGHPGKRPQRQL